MIPHATQFDIWKLNVSYRPRGGVGSEPPQSSDSDEYSTTHSHHQQQAGHGHGQGYGQGQVDVYNVPKVQVSGPPSNDESSSIVNG